jgi:DMSO/TMAO reductase YedYZ molybdopterin-dependent catalytic subunit
MLVGMPSISRGFRGRREHVDPGRVPPGQHVVRDFPVLSAGPTPHTPLDEWSFTISGAVRDVVSWLWQELVDLPAETAWCDGGYTTNAPLRVPHVNFSKRERYGHHDYGDPWREQRYRGD